jgi:hypothetical protein
LTMSNVIFQIVVGPHPHDLYLALSALGAICDNDPLSYDFFAAFGFSTACGTRFGLAAMALRMTT